MTAFESSIESWILSYLVNSLWQVPLLFAAGWIAARALRPVGAGAEHRVWVSVLGLQAILPACPALPWNRMRALFVWAGGGPSADRARVSVTMGTGIGFGAFNLPAGFLAAIAVAYCAVSVYFAARFVWRWWRLGAIRREAREVELTGQAAISWAECCARFGVNEASIASSSRVFSPVTMGLSQKLLLLPAGMDSSLPEADLRTVIAHEFAHIRRNDFFKNLLYESLSVPVSYHPFLRLTRERIMETREIVCDRMAAEADGRSQYTRSLLRLASLLVNGAPVRTPHTIGIFDANTFERRLMKLTEKPAEIRGARRLAIVAACAMFAIATCCSALALRMNVDAAGGNPTMTPAFVHVSAGVMSGLRISGPMPKYPPVAKKAKVQGTVVLNAVISKEGDVKDLVVVSGPPMLQQSSLDAVRQWKYKPYLLNGNPVEVKTTINVIYTLRK